MLSAILLTEDRAAAEAIKLLAAGSRHVSVDRILERYPGAHELIRIVNATTPDLLLLDLGDWETASELSYNISQHCPFVAVIGFGGQQIPRRDGHCSELGINVLLEAPVTPERFAESIDQAIHMVRGGVQQNLLAFLPAKAGSGCTTVVMNTGGCLAGTLSKRVLLLEADLRSGILGTLLRCSPERSLADVLEETSQLDSSRWEQRVSRAHGMDLLLAGEWRKAPLPLWSSYLQLLEFSGRRYDFILADLPEVVNEATREIVRRARCVFVVCTPELVSLSLARRRCKELEERGVPGERVCLLVNRWHRTDMQPKEIRESLDHAVSGLFENDYQSVRKAIIEGQLVSPGTDLGQSYASFAAQVASTPSGVPVYTPRPKTKLAFWRR